MGCKLSVTGNKSPVNQSCVPYPTKIRQKMKYAPPFPDKRGHDQAETDKKHENRRTGNHPARSLHRQKAGSGQAEREYRNVLSCAGKHLIPILPPAFSGNRVTSFPSSPQSRPAGGDMPGKPAELPCPHRYSRSYGTAIPLLHLS